MKKLSCIIVEDEPIATNIIKTYLEQISFLELEATFTDAISALEILNQKQIDVIFLDIHLPKLKGIDFLKTLSYLPKIIITTAYEKYALEGFELEITDYLLKPFSFERFLKAVNRLQKIPATHTFHNLSINERAHRFINVNKKMVKIYIDEIVYVESLKEYVKIYTSEKQIVTKFQLGELEEFLNNNNFLRIHRSFLVAKNKIDSFTAEEVEINGTSIPIGRTYSLLVKKELENI